MSVAPPTPPTPPQGQGVRRTSTGRIVAMVSLVLVLAVTGAGLAGWAAWAMLHGGGGGTNDSALATPPKPSSTAQPPDYPTELAPFYRQRLAWHACGGNQCSRLTVPLDYAEPGGRTIKLAVLRVPAQQRHQRVGQLVVNPGGPGGSSVEYAASSPLGAKVGRYFDIVGVDPRGVGASATLDCGDTAQVDAFLSADPDPDTPAEVAGGERLTRELGQRCLARSGDLVRHMSTVEVAKDMDVLRAALGESRLDYFGASYGTAIGATYANLFPTHVRRMVLDGAIDPSLSSERSAIDQAHGFETALRSYLRNCLDQANCPVGHSVADGSQRIKALLTRLDRAPLRTSSGRQLTEGLATYGIVWPLYVKEYWPLLTLALQQAANGNGDQLLQLSDQYTHRAANGYSDNLMVAFNAVNCLDHDDYVPTNQIPRHVPAFEKASPTFGRSFAYGLSLCASWPVKSGRVSTALHAAGAPPIVVVGTTRDPATPYAEAVALAKQLKSGVLVSRDGDGHTGFGQGNGCVDQAVETYLLAGTPPRNGLLC